MREETLLSLLATVGIGEEPTRWVVDEWTLCVAFPALAFEIEFANLCRIGGRSLLR